MKNKNQTVPVSIVIPVLNEENTVERMLSSIECQTYLPEEVIFVDAGSTDKGKQILKNYTTDLFKIVILEENGAFPGTGRNKGLESAKSEWIAFLDCGVFPENYWLENLYKFIKSNNTQGAYGYCFFSANTSFTKAVCAISYGLNISKPVLPGSIFNKSVFNKIGLFNNTMRSYEDVLWMKKYDSYQNNKKICKSAIVSYSGFPETFFGVIKKWFIYNFTTAKEFVNLFSTLFYMMVPIFGVTLFYNYQDYFFSLIIIYFFLRGIVSPIIKSNNIFWWKKNVGSFFHAFYLSIIIDATKVLAYYSGIIYGIKKLFLLPWSKSTPKINKNNIDEFTVEGFGDEWERFDQSKLSIEEQEELFNNYFDIFPWNKISNQSIGFDLGCGSGRWAKLVAPKVSQLHCIDPSSAIEIARKNLINNHNCKFYKNDVQNIPLDDKSMDFGYSLGVLHHIPDTQSAVKACVSKLKPGAPFLVYLYYSFDNKPIWYSLIWRFTDFIRMMISRLPYSLRYICSQIIALTIYYPLAKASLLLEKIGFNVRNFPLSIYRNCSFYTMRTDALDRFGTRLEKRFSKKEIQNLLESADLENIIFSNNEPYWCAIGTRKEKQKQT
ncbi:MAG: hypothetical protein CMG74_10360 [Candidatus Marinimicrobia bacterium]|nr:hypothetical protein [Candidatus Neomarinimicrobiota bacterium]